MKNTHHYSIKEVSELSGLPESTLRFYETVGIINPIKRDRNSKHRIYNEDDLNSIIGIACLNTTGMSIDDMRTYLKNRKRGNKGVSDQIILLETQGKRIAEEIKHLKIRERYVAIKGAYWHAVASGNTKEIETIKEKAILFSKKELKLPKEK